MKKNYSNVQIFGPFNTGTNLMARIIKYGVIDTINIKQAGGTHICKHTIKEKVLEEHVRKHKDTLFVCMYRPVSFWIESMNNNMYDLVWNKNPKDPCLFRNVKYDTIYHLHKCYYDAYRKLCNKYKNIIWIEYNMIINKELSYQYLTNKLVSTNLKLKNKAKIIDILEKPSKNGNKKFGRNCDEAYKHFIQQENTGIRNKYLFNRETQDFFELGI